MYHMRWHELITNSRKKIESVLMFLKELVCKNGEADELQPRKGNFYDM